MNHYFGQDSGDTATFDSEAALVTPTDPADAAYEDFLFQFAGGGAPASGAQPSMPTQSGTNPISSAVSGLLTATGPSLVYRLLYGAPQSGYVLGPDGKPIPVDAQGRPINQAGLGVGLGNMTLPLLLIGGVLLFAAMSRKK